jgi:phospholipase C
MRSSLWSCSLLVCAVSILQLAGCAGLRTAPTPSPSPSPTPAATFQLTVTAPPAGQGTITSSPKGISCPSTCTASFAEGTKVTLTATPGTNYLFGGWSGACTGTSCTVTISAATTVAASFIEAEGLNVALAGAGSGTVTSSPAGINCPTTCSATFPDKTQVTLTETAGTNFYFGGWGGACTGTTGCSVTVTAAENVTATFTGGDSLTVATSGTGSGTVTSTPAGIDCTSGSATGCTAIFPPGTAVALTEAPTVPNLFSGWSGACTGSAACSVTVSATPASVTAAFAQGGTLQTSVQHIILEAQENRSLDSYFGYLPQYWVNQGIANPPTFNGLAQFMPPANPANAPTQPPCSSPTGQCTADPTGTPVPSFHMQSICTEELSPFWNEGHVDWNYGFLFPSNITWESNGFVQAAANDARDYTDGTVNDTNGYRVMGYFTDQDLNFYYALATDFAISDMWFTPVMSRTQLARGFILGATSDGYAYPPGSNSEDGNPFSSPPIFEVLQNAGVTWRVYVHQDTWSQQFGWCTTLTGSELNQCLADSSYVNEYSWETTVLNTPSLYANFVPDTQFATDAQNGTLAQVSYIDPASDAGLDEHPTDVDSEGGVNIQAGAAHVESLVTALMNSPSWQTSVFIFTYDEAGGFYDHVQPQVVPVPDQYAYPIDLQTGDMCAGANQTTGVCSFGMTGYRIPVVVVSPFSKQNYVSHVVRDTTVWLNLIEERFGVTALNNRDAYWSTAQSGSNGQPNAQMDEFFDFTNPPWITPPTMPTQSQSGTCSLAAPNPWGT